MDTPDKLSNLQWWEWPSMERACVPVKSQSNLVWGSATDRHQTLDASTNLPAQKKWIHIYREGDHSSTDTPPKTGVDTSLPLGGTAARSAAVEFGTYLA